jgi:pimeloyl-ACP methyl ester carboxylesterase
MAFVQLPEVSLEYVEHGHGPRTWWSSCTATRLRRASGTRVQQALPADAYRSIAVNNRGAGASEAPPDERDFTIQKFASDLHANWCRRSS